jgi:hypothetical protein
MSDNLLDHLAGLDAPFPGWYPDPLGEAERRFWNGQSWTGQMDGQVVNPHDLLTADDEVSIIADEVTVVADPEPTIIADPAPATTPEAGQSLFAEPAQSVAGRTVRLDAATAIGLPRPQRIAGVGRSKTAAVSLAAGLFGLGLGALLGVAVLSPSGAVTTAVGSGLADTAQRAATTASFAGNELVEVRAAAALVADQLALTEDRLGALEAELDDAANDTGGVAAERDRLQAHNDLLRTWFAADLIAQGQTAWDTEVARACEAADGGVVASEQLRYVAAMELIGTGDDLARAVQECLNG